MAYTPVDAWDLNTPATMKVKVDRRGIRTTDQSAIVLRRQTFSSESQYGQAAVRRFTVSYPVASKGDYDKAMALWVNTGGGSDGLSFRSTNLAYTGSFETITVRMIGAPFNLTQVTGETYSFSIELEEMLHSPGA
jgi:hypothetical protein|tara:strand:- start:25563 stop:25967 length:405 start_codon:yes stop_codon:yes gene_type:complete